MDAIYVILLIVVAAIVQGVVSGIKRQRNKQLAEPISIREDSESYPHSSSARKDDPYDFESWDYLGIKEDIDYQRGRVMSPCVKSVEKPLDNSSREGPPEHFGDTRHEYGEIPNDILKDLDLRKAMIYAEIFNRKF